MKMTWQRGNKFPADTIRLDVQDSTFCGTKVFGPLHAYMAAIPKFTWHASVAFGLGDSALIIGCLANSYQPCSSQAKIFVPACEV